MTLVEITIVVAIMAMATAVAIPAIGNLTHAELRGNASKLAGMIRSTYDAAALSGQLQRITFDFKSKSIKVSATEQVLAIEPGSNVLAEASKIDEERGEFDKLVEELRAKQELQAPSADPTAPPSGASLASAFFGVNNLAKMGGMAGEEAFKDTEMVLELDDSVSLLDVWVRGMDAATAEGVTYLYFFPHGYTQDALIHLKDKDDNIFTVKVSALTGKTAILGRYVEAKP